MKDRVTTLNDVRSGARLLELHNCLNSNYQSKIGREIREGLTASQKYIPCKYLYDAHGSKLFEEICLLPEYYPTRTELSILSKIAPELMRTFTHKELVELGSGASLKIRILLEATGKANRATIRYIPMDISESAIIESSRDLLDRYPELQVLGIIADFTCQLDVLPNERPLMLCFLGSTIGNMGENESASFMHTVSNNMKPDDQLLVGFDMIKSREIMIAAYNDSRGVTCAFNKNVLNVLNNELKANFNPSHFEHLAFFNEEESRIEMYLMANRNVTVKIASIDMEIQLKKGETIHTENSRKFTRDSIEDLTSRAGLHVQNWYTDPDGWFSLVLMAPNEFNA